MLQDIPTISTFRQLERLAHDRDLWRAHQPCRRNYSARSKAVPNAHKYSLRSKRSAPLSKKRNDIDNKKPTTTAATKYRQRDAHEAFFRPSAPGVKKVPAPKKKRNRPNHWTNKQRQAYAREHWELHHGHKTEPAAANAPITVNTPSPAPLTTVTQPTVAVPASAPPTTKQHNASATSLRTSAVMKAVFSCSDSDTFTHSLYSDTPNIPNNVFRNQLLETTTINSPQLPKLWAAACSCVTPTRTPSPPPHLALLSPSTITGHHLHYSHTSHTHHRTHTRTPPPIQLHSPPICPLPLSHTPPPHT